MDGPGERNRKGTSGVTTEDEQPRPNGRGCSCFPRPVFLHVFREVYIVVMLHSAARMTTIARYLGHILALSIAAVVAAIFGIPTYAATAHFVSAFPFVRHI